MSCKERNVDKLLRIEISAGAVILLAVLLLILPLQWVIAALLAATFHELCHAFAILLCGGSIDCISVSGRGAVMSTKPLTVTREVLCAIAGPVGSFLLLLLARWLPRTAVCGAVQGLYNLLPLFPMDGGRVLRGLIYGLFSPPVAQRIFVWSQRFVALLLIAGCAMLSFQIGLIAVALLILLFWRRWREKHLPRMPFGGTIDAVRQKEYGYDRVTKENSPIGAETGAVHRRGV